MYKSDLEKDFPKDDCPNEKIDKLFYNNDRDVFNEIVFEHLVKSDFDKFNENVIDKVLKIPHDKNFEGIKIPQKKRNLEKEEKRKYLNLRIKRHNRIHNNKIRELREKE